MKVKEHYDQHLHSYYSWIYGGFENNPLNLQNPYYTLDGENYDKLILKFETKGISHMVR